METMQAIVISEFGAPDVLQLRIIPRPQTAPGTLILRVRAFGINHAESYFRRGLWGDVARVSGIECVGEVEEPGSSALRPGQRVFALTGGMGRGIDGSYAEYVRVPLANVVPIESDLPWSVLAALPESYGTAWVFLNHNLACRAGQTLLVRGATSALGQAAVQLAHALDVRVLGTTRSRDKLALLAGLGAQPLLDDDTLDQHVRSQAPEGVDAVLDILGTATLLESLRAVRYGGRVALAGFLAGTAPLPSFDPLQHLPSGVQLSFFASAFAFGTAACPLAGIPFQRFVDGALSGVYAATPAHVFAFEDIVAAHQLMESGKARGKIVVMGPAL